MWQPIPYGNSSWIKCVLVHIYSWCICTDIFQWVVQSCRDMWSSLEAWWRWNIHKIVVNAIQHGCLLNEATCMYLVPIQLFNEWSNMGGFSIVRKDKPCSGSLYLLNAIYFCNGARVPDFTSIFKLRTNKRRICLRFDFLWTRWQSSTQQSKGTAGFVYDFITMIIPSKVMWDGDAKVVVFVNSGQIFSQEGIFIYLWTTFACNWKHRTLLDIEIH